MTDAGSPDAPRSTAVVELETAEGRASTTAATAASTTSSSSLVNTIETWRWSPASPDPSGLAYDSTTNRLLVVDGEVDEMSIYAGANYYEATLAGTLVRTTNTRSFSNEPVGLAFDPTGRAFVSDDNQRKVFQVTLGDGRLDRTDPVTSFSTSSFGSGDPEGAAYDRVGDRLFIADGVNSEIYDVSAVDGVFGNGNDQVRHFDTRVLGIVDPEAVEFYAAKGTLYAMGADGAKIVEVTTSGTLVSEIDTSYLPLDRPAGLAYAPRSTDPAQKSFYITDRKVDNNNDPKENDGAIYEIAPGSSGGGSTPAPGDVRVAAGSDDAEEPASGSVSLTSSDLELVTESSVQTVGVRFAGVAIPVGAIITNAYIQFTADESRSEGTALAFRAQAADNAPTFTTATFNVSARPRTAASAAWSPAAWATGEAGANQRTPDLKTSSRRWSAAPAGRAATRSRSSSPAAGFGPASPTTQARPARRSCTSSTSRARGARAARRELARARGTPRRARVHLSSGSAPSSPRDLESRRNRVRFRPLAAPARGRAQNGGVVMSYTRGRLMTKERARTSRSHGLRGRLLLFALMAFAAALFVSPVAQAVTKTGTAGANRLAGTSSADSLYGLGGADVLLGRAGRDVLSGGGGNDVLAGGKGADRVKGGSGSDRLYGGPGKDVLVCGAGHDHAYPGPTDRTAADCEDVHQQHGTDEGHLIGTGEWGKIELVSKAVVTEVDDLVADVAVSPDGNYAYLANWGEPDCGENSEAGGINSPDAGAWVIDISDLENPREVNFIPMPQDTRPGEGMHVSNVETKWFSGQILVMNAEGCGKNYKGGFMLYDVSNPLKPVKLKEGFGERGWADAHQTHSAFVWQPTPGGPAYLVTQDEEDLSDLDIYDITNPRRPRLISELNLNEFDVAQFDLNLGDSSLHDMTVKCMTTGEYAGKCILLASYWDGGYVLLDVTDPANPMFLGDTDFASIDPELFEQTGIRLTPEGNAHQAEFTADNQFFIGTDEDFSPYRALVRTDDGGEYPAGEFGWTIPISDLYGTLNGPTVFGGYGCPADRGSIPDASTLTLAEGEEAILVLQRGPVGDPSQTQDACFFSEKVETAQLLGYDAVVIANHHSGALGGEAPDAQFCGGQGHIFEITISAICVGHRAMHELFDDPDPTDNFTYPESAPAVGTVGDTITVTTEFDGWGYVHLFDAATLEDLDTYAIPEAMDPAFASGFGDLSVHEVATDPQDPTLAYLSYYSGGLRAIQIQCSDPADNTTCELVEVGGYLDPMGNDFWGVEAFVGDDGFTYILASDRDSGLWIFRDP